MACFAMLFPGQGAQSVGMLGSLADRHPLVAETWTEASDALGYDLAALIAEGPAEKLDQTEYTQPALVAASVAVWRVWRDRGGPQPALMAGHSLGEYSALVAAGAFSFADALRLTQARARAMQAAVAPGEGAMAAIIGLDDAAVIAACHQAEQTHAEAKRVVSAANFNAPLQVVIAGHAAAVETAGSIARANGAKLVKPLAVSVPSHCALMAPAAERLEAELDTVSLGVPQVPVRHNVDAQTRDSVDGIRDALVCQLAQSVRWADTVRAMRSDGVDLFLECGPGTVLAGLNKRIDKQAVTLSLSNPEQIEPALHKAGEGDVDA